MEEDIKIIEDMIKRYKIVAQNLFNESIIKPRKRPEVKEFLNEIKAMENVIHELRYNKTQFEIQLREKLDLQANSIPISVIQKYKEKYERYKKQTNVTLLRETFGSKVDVLDELLQESEK